MLFRLINILKEFYGLLSIATDDDLFGYGFSNSLLSQAYGLKWLTIEFILFAVSAIPALRCFTSLLTS